MGQNSNDEYLTVTFTINKINNSADVTVNYWEYDNPCLPTIVTEFGEPEIYYTVDNVAYTTDMPQNAGDYYFVVYIYYIASNK